jgi:hypothetical protein
MIRVRLGLKPRAARVSHASMMAISEPLSSMEPRPQTAPFWIAPENGGAFQRPSVPGETGTTSWCAINTTGGSAGSDPFQV